MDYSLLKNKLYLYLLANYNGAVKPSFVELSKKLDMTRQTISIHYKKLVSDGVVLEDGKKITVTNPLNISIVELRQALDSGVFDEKKFKQMILYQNARRAYIIEDSSEFTPAGTIVYGIMSEGKIKYVGSSKNFYERIKQHIRKRPFLEEKDFVILKEVPYDQNRFNYELELIHLLQPEWNIIGTEK